LCHHFPNHVKEVAYELQFYGTFENNNQIHVISELSMFKREKPIPKFPHIWGFAPCAKTIKGFYLVTYLNRRKYSWYTQDIVWIKLFCGRITEGVSLNLCSFKISHISVIRGFDHIKMHFKLTSTWTIVTIFASKGVKGVWFLYRNKRLSAKSDVTRLWPCNNDLSF